MLWTQLGRLVDGWLAGSTTLLDSQPLLHLLLEERPRVPGCQAVLVQAGFLGRHGHSFAQPGRFQEVMSLLGLL